MSVCLSAIRAKCIAIDRSSSATSVEALHCRLALMSLATNVLSRGRRPVLAWTPSPLLVDGSQGRTVARAWTRHGTLATSAMFSCFDASSDQRAWTCTNKCRNPCSTCAKFIRSSLSVSWRGLCFWRQCCKVLPKSFVCRVQTVAGKAPALSPLFHSRTPLHYMLARAFRLLLPA